MFSGQRVWGWFDGGRVGGDINKHILKNKQSQTTQDFKQTKGRDMKSIAVSFECFPAFATVLLFTLKLAPSTPPPLSGKNRVLIFWHVAVCRCESAQAFWRGLGEGAHCGEEMTSCSCSAVFLSCVGSARGVFQHSPHTRRLIRRQTDREIISLTKTSQTKLNSLVPYHALPPWSQISPDASKSQTSLQFSANSEIREVKFTPR